MFKACGFSHPKMAWGILAQARSRQDLSATRTGAPPPVSAELLWYLLSCPRGQREFSPVLRELEVILY